MHLRTKALRPDFSRANEGVDDFFTAAAAAVEPDLLFPFSGEKQSVY